MAPGLTKMCLFNIYFYYFFALTCGKGDRF